MVISQASFLEEIHLNPVMEAGHSLRVRPLASEDVFEPRRVCRRLSGIVVEEKTTNEVLVDGQTAGEIA